jgi:hypothetical protein
LWDTNPVLLRRAVTFLLPAFLRVATACNSFDASTKALCFCLHAWLACTWWALLRDEGPRRMEISETRKGSVGASERVSIRGRTVCTATATACGGSRDRLHPHPSSLPSSRSRFHLLLPLSLILLLLLHTMLPALLRLDLQPPVKQEKASSWPQIAPEVLCSASKVVQNLYLRLLPLHSSLLLLHVTMLRLLGTPSLLPKPRIEDSRAVAMLNVCSPQDRKGYLLGRCLPCLHVLLN